MHQLLADLRLLLICHASQVLLMQLFINFELRVVYFQKHWASCSCTKFMLVILCNFLANSGSYYPNIYSYIPIIGSYSYCSLSTLDCYAFCFFASSHINLSCLTLFLYLQSKSSKRTRKQSHGRSLQTPSLFRIILRAYVLHLLNIIVL